MYLSLLRDMEFPRKYVTTYDNITPRDVLDLARQSGVIARVRIETPEAEFPHHTDAGTEYPTGRFTTCLTGPELLAVAERGRIVNVIEAASYRMGPVFRDAALAILDSRQRAKDCGDDDIEAISKAVGVSLGGKCAQRQGGWTRAPNEDIRGKWGEERFLNERTNQIVRYKWQCGFAWRYDEEKLPRGPHTYAFAYLTAYGRLMMRRLRAKCPLRSVVLQDTDGILVTDSALTALLARGPLADGVPGQLRREGSGDSALILGPKHYLFGDQWKLSGLNWDSVDLEAGRIHYSYHSPLWSRRDKCAPTSAFVVNREAKIPSGRQAGQVGSDGWIVPPHYLSTWSESKQEK